MNQSELNILLSSKEFRFRRVFWNDYLVSIDSNTLLKQYGVSGAGKDCSRVSLKVDATAEELINRVSGKNKMLTYVIFLSLVEYLLHRYTGEKQVMVFIPEQNGKYSFNRYLPFLTEVRPTMSYREYLGEIKNRLAELIKNQDYPVEQVLEHLDEGKLGQLENLSNVMCTIDDSVDKYDSDFVFNLSMEDGYLITLKYKNDKADELFAKRALQHIEILFKECLGNAGILLGDIDYLTDREKVFWKEEYNKPYGNIDKTVVELFEKNAKISPDSIAVVSKDKEVTYGELDRRANALARRIIEEGVKKGDVVGIIMDTTTEVVVSML
ncbi:MAG: AMP-binding protein, partial [Roseburia sp.]